MSLPAADHLFRRTEPPAETSMPRPLVQAVPDPRAPEPAGRSGDDEPRPRPSGRVRHDEKMTVYVTSAELLELERARLQLRALHGLAADRGRVVREALHLVLEDFERRGDESDLVRRLTEEP